MSCTWLWLHSCERLPQEEAPSSKILSYWLSLFSHVRNILSKFLGFIQHLVSSEGGNFRKRNINTPSHILFVNIFLSAHIASELWGFAFLFLKGCIILMLNQICSCRNPWVLNILVNTDFCFPESASYLKRYRAKSSFSADEPWCL